MTTYEARPVLPAGRDRAGSTLRAFRLNAVVSHLMFAGRRGRVYDRLVALSGVRPGEAMLDVGSGSGYLSRRLRRLPPSAPAGPSVRVTSVRIGVAPGLPLPDASFDVVTCTLAMHRIPYWQRPAAVAEMFRVTRPGGRLLLADLAPLPRLGRPATAGAADATEALADLIEAAGFHLDGFGALPLLRYVVAARPARPFPAFPRQRDERADQSHAGSVRTNACELSAL